VLIAWLISLLTLKTTEAQDGFSFHDAGLEQLIAVISVGHDITTRLERTCKVGRIAETFTHL
jgi:hypothetical protein